MQQLKGKNNKSNNSDVNFIVLKVIADNITCADFLNLSVL